VSDHVKCRLEKTKRRQNVVLSGEDFGKSQFYVKRRLEKTKRRLEITLKTTFCLVTKRRLESE